MQEEGGYEKIMRTKYVGGLIFSIIILTLLFWF